MSHPTASDPARRLRERLVARLNRWNLVLAITGLLILLTIGGYAYYRLVHQASETAQEPTLQTAIASRGDLVISATGTGTLTAPQEELGFTGTGEMTVTGVYVKAGDLVQTGQLLAEVNSEQAESAYNEAKNNYSDLTSITAIASSERAMADAAAEWETAKINLEYLISPDVYYWETEMDKGERELRKAEARVQKYPADEDAAQTLKTTRAFLDFAQDQLHKAWNRYKYKYVPTTFEPGMVRGELVYLQSTDLEIQQARAAIGEALTQLKEAQELHSVLTGAPMPVNTTNKSLIAVEQAKRTLEEAQANLNGTKIVAPFSGTVMEVNASGGSSVERGTSKADVVDARSIVVLADTSHPYLDVYWDESDWSKLKVGEDVKIIFNDLPEQVIEGKITEVDRQVYTSNNSRTIHGKVSMQNANNGSNLPIGASASVEAIAQLVTNATLIPIEALHKAGAEQYMVFVVQGDKLKLRQIEIGLMNDQYVEVKSGLQPGEVLSTGVAKTQ
jgi:RND family efflux transporter MFP subunit